MLGTKFRISSLERLESRALLSTVIFESKHNNSALKADVVTLDPVDNAAILTGTIRPGDRDFFLVPIANPGKLTVTFQDRGKAIIELNVYDAATGQPLFAGSVRSGTRSGTFNVSMGERIMFRIVDNNQRSGTYRLNFSETVAHPIIAGSHPSTSVGVNVDIHRALGFDSNGNGHVAGTLADANDIHLWNFKAPKSGRLTLIVSNNSAPVIVEILDASGQAQITIYSDIPNFTSSININAGAKYQVRIRPQMMTPFPYMVNLNLV